MTEAREGTGSRVAVGDLAKGLHLVLRPDHGAGVGAGHLARCLALGQAWRDLGGSVQAASSGPLKPVWERRYADEGFEVRRVSGWLDGDVLVLDGYSFGSTAQHEAPPATLLVLDDLGQVTIERADLILDQNYGAVARPTWPLAARTLLGPRYAMLRRDLAANASDPRLPTAAEPPLVLISAGGEPDPAWLAWLGSAVHRAGPAGAETVVLDGRQDMATVLRRASVAVTASGSIIWELLAFGVASVVVAFAENQRPIARALGRGGVAVDGGDYATVDIEVLGRAIGSLLTDDARRTQLVARGRELVDGHGAARVARELILAARAKKGLT